MPSSRSLDILIPTLNSGKVLSKSLKSIQKIKEKHSIELNVIIIDGGSTDNTIEIAQSFQARVVNNPRKPHTIGSSRNLGIKKANSDYVALIDSDETLDSKWLDVTLQMMEQGYKLITGQIIPNKAGSYGKIYINLRNLKPQLKQEFNNFNFRPIRCCELNLAKKTQYDPNIHLGEDFDFGYRVFKAGLPLIFNPDIIIYHEISQKLGQVLLKEKSYGIGVINLLFKYRNITFLKYCIINLLYTLSPIYYRRIIKSPNLNKKDSIVLIIFGLLKSLMNFFGYLHFILNHNKAYRKKQ